jgi:hypothetical protein
MGIDINQMSEEELRELREEWEAMRIRIQERLDELEEETWEEREKSLWTPFGYITAKCEFNGKGYVKPNAWNYYRFKALCYDLADVGSVYIKLLRMDESKRKQAVWLIQNAKSIVANKDK